MFKDIQKLSYDLLIDAIDILPVNTHGALQIGEFNRPFLVVYFMTDHYQSKWMFKYFVYVEAEGVWKAEGYE